jgi:hypothetical protein
MLLAVPYQAIEVENLLVQPFQLDKRGRLAAPLFYRTPSQQGLLHHGLTLLSPPLPVSSYDSSLNRLQLTMSNHRLFANTLLGIQELLEQQDASASLYRLCSQNSITLYTSTPVLQGTDYIPLGMIRPGDLLRCVIRFHTLVRLGSRLRLDHSVPVLIGING